MYLIFKSVTAVEQLTLDEYFGAMNAIFDEVSGNHDDDRNNKLEFTDELFDDIPLNDKGNMEKALLFYIKYMDRTTGEINSFSINELIMKLNVTRTTLYE